MNCEGQDTKHKLNVSFPQEICHASTSPTLKLWKPEHQFFSGKSSEANWKTQYWQKALKLSLFLPLLFYESYIFASLLQKTPASNFYLLVDIKKGIK